MSQSFPFSSEDLDHFFSLSSDFLAIAGEDGFFKRINPTFEQVLGWSTEQLLAQPFFDLIHPDDQAASQAEVARLLRGERTVEFINRFRCVDGRWRWLEWNVSSAHNATAEQVQFYCVARDVTRRQQAEAETQALTVRLEAKVNQRTAQIRRYAEAIESMQDGFYLWQLEDLSNAKSFRLLVANPAAEQLTQIPNSDVLSKTMAEGFPELIKSEVPEIYRQIVLTGQEQDLGDVDYVIPTGETRTYAVKAFPLAEQCLGVLFEDVTLARAIQKDIYEKKEQLRVIFDQAGIGIARLTPAGQWIQCNASLCAILGYEPSELIATDFQSITHPDDLAADQRYYERLLSGDIDTASFEKRYLHKNGEPVWCSVTASLIRDQDQQPGYFIAFVENISDRKQFELQLQRQKGELVRGNRLLAQATTRLERQNRDLNDFAYVASHDLKAPLRAIGNIATWLEEDLEEQLSSANRQHLDLLQGRVQRLEGLIDGLLAYSRVGQEAKSVERVDLNQLLRDVVELLFIPEGFQVDVAPDLPCLQANSAALALIFRNLIDNGLKHNPNATGWVKVRWDEGGNDTYEFTVTDNGPGIDAAYHERIFNIFQVLEARDKKENTGIGLSIVKKTVEVAGGHISVISTVGQGTTFRVIWPRHPQSAVSE